MPWFDPCLAHVTFLVDKVAFFPSAFVSPVSIIPPMHLTDLPLNTTLFRWTSGRSLGTLKHGSSYVVEHLKEKYFHAVSFCLQRVKLFWDMLYLLFWFKRRGVKHEETVSFWGICIWQSRLYRGLNFLNAIITLEPPPWNAWWGTLLCDLMGAWNWKNIWFIG